MENVRLKLRHVDDGGISAEEVFYYGDYIGNVADIYEDGTWLYRTTYSLMWWKALDKDDAILELIKIVGTKD